MVDKRSFLRHRYKIGLLVAVLLVILVSSIYAFYYVTLPPEQGPGVSLLSPPLEFWLQLDKASFSKGEIVNVRIGLKNMGNESVKVEWWSYSSSRGQTIYFDFSVVDENDSKIYQWGEPHGWFGSTKVENLLPGRELNSTYQWEMVDSYDYPIAGGTYSIRALSRRMTVTVADESSVMTLETPSIAILIS